jgi:hypothetical protein
MNTATENRNCSLRLWALSVSINLSRKTLRGVVFGLGMKSNLAGATCITGVEVAVTPNFTWCEGDRMLRGSANFSEDISTIADVGSDSRDPEPSVEN